MDPGTAPGVTVVAPGATTWNSLFDSALVWHGSEWKCAVSECAPGERFVIEMVAELYEREFERLMPLTYAAFQSNGRVAP